MNSDWYLNLARLRAAVVERGGEWTTNRAATVLNDATVLHVGAGGPISRARARQLMQRLATEGVVDVRYGARGYVWTARHPARSQTRQEARL